MIFFIFLGAVYTAFNLYITVRFLSLFKAAHTVFEKKHFIIPFCILYWLGAFSMLIAFFMPWLEAKRPIQHIANYWLGILLYIALFMGLSDLIYFILYKAGKINFSNQRKTRLTLGMAAVILISGFSLYGIMHASKIEYTEYSNVTVNKECGNLKDLKIALTADYHLGFSIGIEHVKKSVELINNEEPDIVLIAGDIFDNDFDAIENPDKIAEEFRKIKSKYGVYAVYGNHDVSEKILGGFTFKDEGVRLHDPRAEEFCQKANINIMTDDTVLIDNSFYLIGRLDGEKPGVPENKRKSVEELTAGLDKTKPIIMLDHEPDELDKKSANGVDLNLCGHTHDGQLFPGNITINFFWENPYGLLKKGQMYSIVTSGVGIWGPNMRVGTTAEVVGINVEFKNEN